jgi:hypothetical protein
MTIFTCLALVGQQWDVIHINYFKATVYVGSTLVTKVV